MTPHDHILVGSGLAALSVAALLAQAGRKVLVLEAHDKPGGYGHTFEMAGYRFNAQLHYVWNVAPERTVGRFLHKLGLSERVPFVQLDPQGYDHMRLPGFALDIPGDLEELTRRLVARFPSHAEALRAFVDEVRWTDEALQALPSSWWEVGGLVRDGRVIALLRHKDATLQDVFDRFGLPAEAAALLALQWPDFLLPPDQLSFFAWVMLFCGYGRGAWYPEHHFDHVIDTLVETIRAHGGEVRCQAKVTGFLWQGDRICGVRIEQTDAHGVATGQVDEARGAEVICNMDPQAAAHLIGLERFAPKVRRRLLYTYAPSSFVAYCGVKGVDLRDHGFGAWNVFHADTPDLNGLFRAMHDRGDYSQVSFAMSTPTLISDAPGAAPEGHQILELLTVASHERFLEARLNDAKAYRQLKQRVFDAMIDVVDRDYLPGIRDVLTVHILGSPTSSERYARAPAGNAYGASLIPSQMGPGRLDHRSSIPGLHFCNASAGYPGFAGTIWTGCHLYETLTGDRFL